MSVTKSIVPSISIDGKQFCINVGRDVIRALKYPDYICILESDSQNAIAITPCDESVVLSFHVPEGFPEDRKRKFRIYSQKLVSEIFDHCKLQAGRRYTLKGGLDDSMNAVVFHLDETEEYSRREI